MACCISSRCLHERLRQQQECIACSDCCCVVRLEHSHGGCAQMFYFCLKCLGLSKPAVASRACCMQHRESYWAFHTHSMACLALFKPASRTKSTTNKTLLFLAGGLLHHGVTGHTNANRRAEFFHTACQWAQLLDTQVCFCCELCAAVQVP